ncbi:MAG: hypothetical protein ACRD43_08845 [Pyrinomonadaceae bacterium]
MLKKIMMLAAALTVFTVIPAFADQNCSTGNFVGTYTRATGVTDPVGDGVLHNAIFQITFHADGTATQYWTGLPDYMINTGSGSINIGAWKCKNNGNVIATFLSATYSPVPANDVLGTVADISLTSHVSTTYVFTITDNNTLTRTKAASTSFAPELDPTDPANASLGSPSRLNDKPFVYKRLVASNYDIANALPPLP